MSENVNRATEEQRFREEKQEFNNNKPQEEQQDLQKVMKSEVLDI